MQEIYFWSSIIVFSLTFLWILSEKIHRSIIALLGAIWMSIVGNHLWFYEFHEVLHSIDFNTLLLLSGMMVLVEVLEKSGFFEYLAIRIAKRTHGSYWVLLVSLGSLAAILSMILDNVTTMILMAPITLIITRILHFNPVPLLMSQAMLSNIAGIGTLVWDPTAIIIGSAAGFSFLEFLTHSLPVVILTLISGTLYMLYSCRKENKVKPKFIKKLLALNEKESITKPIVMKKALIVLAGVVILFFTHHLLHLPPSIVAILWAATILLLVAPHDNPQKYLKKVELSVLVFFSSLFVLVGWLEAAGVLEYLAGLISQWVEENIIMTAIVILWVTALLSAIIDNIPMTIAMIPIIGYFELQWVSGVNILWWALVFGVWFGGNMSPIGSTANVVVIAKLELAGKKIHFWQWVKAGVPVTFFWLTIASAGIMLFGSYFAM